MAAKKIKRDRDSGAWALSQIIRGILSTRVGLNIRREDMVPIVREIELGIFEELSENRQVFISNFGIITPFLQLGKNKKKQGGFWGFKDGLKGLSDGKRYFTYPKDSYTVKFYPDKYFLKMIKERHAYMKKRFDIVKDLYNKEKDARKK